jgi:glycerol uptake facilitator protein
MAHAFLPVPGKGTSDWSYAWIPVAGPVAGGLIGAGLFRMIFY